MVKIGGREGKVFGPASTYEVIFPYFLFSVF